MLSVFLDTGTGTPNGVHFLISATRASAFELRLRHIILSSSRTQAGTDERSDQDGRSIRDKRYGLYAGPSTHQ